MWVQQACQKCQNTWQEHSETRLIKVTPLIGHYKGREITITNLNPETCPHCGEKYGQQQPTSERSGESTSS